MNETDLEDIARRAGFIELPEDDADDGEGGDGLVATLRRFLGRLAG